MMKIHTTQNLNDSGANFPSTNVSSSRNFRLGQSTTNYGLSEKSVAFKGKAEIVKKVAQATHNKRYTNVLESKWFRKLLDLMDHEVLVSALISAVVCLALRPATILAMSFFSKKSKEDNIYAATQSIASGTAGMIATLLISFPFSKGLQHAKLENYGNKLLKKNKDVNKLKEMLKKMRPDIDPESIYDKAKNVIKPEKEWKTVDGRSVTKSMKDVLTVARPTHYSECSVETFKDFGLDVDLTSQKGKSLYDMVTKDGNKLIEKLDDKDMFIAVKEEGMDGSIKDCKDTNFFSLKFIDKDFLLKISPDISIESIEKDGKRLHPTKWLKKDGTPWLDKKMADNIHLPSSRETFESTPIYTGVKRPGDNKKYASYLNNIENYKLGDIPTELGTTVTKEFADADKLLDVKRKLVTWIPDIVTRPLVASGTVALIPWVLSNVFHLSKSSSKKADDKSQVSKNVGEVEKLSKDIQDEKTPAFKGKLGDFIGDVYAKFYGDSMMYGKDWLQKLSAWAISKDKDGKMTEHMSTLGSFITSGVYMQQTLTNDKLDKQKRTTLAINQGLCFVIPTILAYRINSMLGGYKKKVEHDFSGAMRGLVQKGEVSDAEYQKFVEKLPRRLKSVNTLAALLTFTLTYRYATPVLITPFANMLGSWWNSRREKKETPKVA